MSKKGQSQSSSNSGAQNQNQNQNQNVTSGNSQSQNEVVTNGGEGASNTSSQSTAVASGSQQATSGSQQSHSSVYDKFGIDLADDSFANKVVDFMKFLSKSEAGDGGESKGEANEANEAERRVALAETKVKLLEAGITASYVDDALVLVNAKLGGDTKAEDVIGSLKEKFPSWFTSSGEGAKQLRGTGMSFQASKSGASSGSNVNETSIGRRLAASRRQSKSKFSYFGNK